MLGTLVFLLLIPLMRPELQGFRGLGIGGFRVKGSGLGFFWMFRGLGASGFRVLGLGFQGLGCVGVQVVQVFRGGAALEF